MMLSMVPFVAAIVLPACAFYLYALGHFLREALQMRRERLSAVRFAAPEDNAPATARNRNAVLTFLPSHSRHSQRGAA